MDWRFAIDPGPYFLELPCKPENGGLIGIAGNDLYADRKTVVGPVQGEGHGRLTTDVEGHCKGEV